MWRHIDVQSDRRSSTYGRATNAIDISQGFYNVPVQAPTRGQPFLRLFRETVQFSRLLRHDGDTDDLFSSLTHGVPKGI